MGRRRRRRKSKSPTKTPQNEANSPTPDTPPESAESDEPSKVQPCSPPAPLIPPDVYLGERSKLIELESKGAEQYDKAMLTLSAGALALSLTFVEKLAPSPKAETLWLLGSAWACFVTAVTSTMGSFLSSQAACRKQRELWDYRTEGKSTVSTKDEINRYADCTRWLNRISFIGFIVGVIFLSCFSWTNLGDTKPMSKDDVKKSQIINDPSKTGAGVVPPKPPQTPTGTDAPAKPKKDK